MYRRLFKRKHDLSPRIIYPSTLMQYDKHNTTTIHYKSALNYIKTTKYTLLTFIPYNLWEQLHRFANIYFIFILILNFIPEIDAFAKEIAPIPVLITLIIVAIKDAYEDFRRYLLDRKVNKKPCEVYSVQEKQYIIDQWQYLRPGDFVRLHTNDIIPADILLLATSNSTGICHIETSNLDGESNLKQREIISNLLNKDEFSPLTFLYPIEVEAPSPELYKFHGKIILPEIRIPIHKNNMLLRGCVLRNTDYVIGIVIYAGCETKAALNNSGVRFKRSKLEKQINLDVIWCVLILVVVCVTGAIGSAVWHQNLPGDDVLFVALDRNSSTSTPAYQGFLNFWRFVIIFQTIIPLPLYVTIEFVKMHQVWHMNNDLQLYDSNLDRRIEIRTFNIPEDLGQIEYVFTDKTGTLTENKMEFKRASINGKDYHTDDGDYHENNDQFSNHSSPKHIVTNLNTLQSILENRTIFSYHQKTINNDMEYSDHSSRNYYFNTDKEINNIEFITIQPSNEIPSTSHIQMDDTNTPSYYLSHSISSPSSQQNNLNIEKQSKMNEKSDHLLNEKCNSIENKSKPLDNQVLLSEEIRIQDFFLALAICNTTVVSVTKNTPTMFQEPPPRRKGFRDFFRSGKFNSVTYLHQKLRKTKQQQQQQSQPSTTLLGKSNIIIKDKIDNNNDNHHLSRVKQTINLSNLFSNKLRSTKIDKTNTQSDKLNDHHHHHDHNSNISSNLLVTNNINHNTIINHTNLINHEETSQETFIMDDSISTKLDDIEIQSIKTNENYHRNEINQIDNNNNNNNNNNQLLKINNININSARLFNEFTKDNYYKESILYYYSSRCLPPVIEALNLDIIFKNSNHILNNNNIQMNIENKKFIGHCILPQYENNHLSSYNSSSISMDELNLHHSSIYIQQSDFESLESANHRFDLNKDIKLDNQHDNDENLTMLKDLKLNLVKEKSVQNDKNQLEEELEINTARTLTVRIHNGSSFELPIESDIYAQTPSELKQCPLSDNTLFNSYESESPDEICLVKEACKRNYKLLQRGVDFILLWLPKDGLVCIHVLRILPFDSKRKRMSIIFRHPYTNEPILFTKGADSSIMNRLDNTGLNSRELITATQEQIDHYSRLGLRTLVIAERLLTEDELHEWLKEVYEIETGDENSTEAMMIMMDKLERNFILLGATGIEDRLQNGVPETIDALREAGMHVWMLTGDKQETAVNIARSANLITPQHRVMYINSRSEARIEYLLNSYLYNIISGQLWDCSNELDDKLEKFTNPRYSNSQQQQQQQQQQHNNKNHQTNHKSKRKSNLHRSFSHSPHRSRTIHRVRIIPTQKPSSLPRDITYFHEYNNTTNNNNKKTKQKNFFNFSKFLKYYRLLTRQQHHPKRKVTNYKRHSNNNHNMDNYIPLALVIDGESLNYVLNNERNKSQFIKLCDMCTNIICCRSTPGQKAAVVSLVKDQLNAQTLAIGDGANDVNMIQVANVGIGINSGEEGMQAVMASDFAISRFYLLKQLLLVHGHWCYDKLAHASLYLFYKDAIYIFLLFWFQMFNGFSGSNAIDQLSQILFSVTMTSLPPFIMGIWDNPLDDKTLLANPILYRSGINGNAYRPWLFWMNIFDALWQSLIIFFLSYFTYSDDNIGLWEFGLFQTNATILCTLFHSLIITRTLVILHAVSFFVSYILSYLIFTMIYHTFAVTVVPPECPYRIIFRVMNDIKFWLLTLVTIILALLPRLLIIIIKNTFYPNMDTIGNLLAKYLGRGKHLPLEPYLLHIPYSLMMRNRFSIQSTINHLSSCISEINLNNQLINKSYKNNNLIEYNSSLTPISLPSSSSSSDIQSNLIKLNETPIHLIKHLHQLLNVSSQLMRGVQPIHHLYVEDISKNSIGIDHLHQQQHRQRSSTIPRIITDYNNCQYDQNDIHKRHHHHHRRHYHTFNGRLLIKQQNKTDFDDETNDKDFDKSKISSIWPAINPNNRIRNSIQASNSSMNIDLSTIGHRSRGSKCQKQTQQQQQYFTYPSARYSSGHRPPLCQNGHFPFELDPREYSSTNQSQEEINES
ncbi:unnamed protein product [Schistosoma haematobium]|nr:unnamed protein product [Schistosoma haematobium]